MTIRRVPCVGAVVHDARGRLLVVLRAREPSAGTWSVPGGRVERGEDDATAVRREVREETGLDVVVGRLLGRVERPGRGGDVYDIADYACALSTTSAPDPVAGDDAVDARWVGAAALALLPTAPGLVDALRAWGVLPR